MRLREHDRPTPDPALVVGCADCLELAAEDLEEDNEPGRTASTAPPPGTASSGGASPVRPAGRPDGDEQQGLEAGFEQKAGRKRLDVFAHVDSLRFVLEGLSSFHRRTQAIKTPPAD